MSWSIGESVLYGGDLRVIMSRIHMTGDGACVWLCSGERVRVVELKKVQGADLRSFEDLRRR